MKHRVKLKKNKHSSSTARIAEGSGAALMGQVQGGEKKKVRRKLSCCSPNVAVGSQIQLPKGRKDSTKQDSTKETMPGR